MERWIPIPLSEPVLDLIGERGQALIGEWESIFIL